MRRNNAAAKIRERTAVLEVITKQHEERLDKMEAGFEKMDAGISKIDRILSNHITEVNNNIKNIQADISAIKIDMANPKYIISRTKLMAIIGSILATLFASPYIWDLIAKLIK